MAYTATKAAMIAARTALQSAVAVLASRQTQIEAARQAVVDAQKAFDLAQVAFLADAEVRV